MCAPAAAAPYGMWLPMEFGDMLWASISSVVRVMVLWTIGRGLNSRMEHIAPAHATLHKLDASLCALYRPVHFFTRLLKFWCSKRPGSEKTVCCMCHFRPSAAICLLSLLSFRPPSFCCLPCPASVPHFRLALQRGRASGERGEVGGWEWVGFCSIGSSSHPGPQVHVYTRFSTCQLWRKWLW